MMCFLINLISLIFVISSSSFFCIWMMMEISSFYFIPLIMSSKKMPFFYSMWKYYLSQVIASFLFFYSLVIMNLDSDLEELALLISLLMKLGAFPFFGWMFNSMEKMDWSSFLLLSSTQKIIPLYILSYISSVYKSYSILLFIIFSSIILISFFFLKKSSRFLLMVSSIYNTNWLILSSLAGEGELFIYLFMYFNLLLMITFSVLKSWSEDLSFQSGGKVFWGKKFEIFLFLFYMGIPPMGMFIGKVEILILLIHENENFLIPLIFLFFTSVSSYLYLLFIYNLAIFSSSSYNSKNHLLNDNNYLFVIYILFIHFLMWWIFY